MLLSSTLMSRFTVPPSETEPPPLKPLPAVRVIALFASFALVIEPASMSFSIAPAEMVIAPAESIVASPDIATFFQ